MDNGGYVRWSIGTAVACVFGCGIGTLVTGSLINIVPVSIHWLVLGAVLGLCVGLAQTKLFPLDYPIQRWQIWVLLSGVAGSISFLMLMPIIEHNIRSARFPDTFAGIGSRYAGGAICGLLLGCFQWILLRSSHRRLGRYIIANVIGWTLGWGLLGGLISWILSGLD